MKPNCHICTAPSNFLLKKDGYDLYKCPTCALVFVYPLPAQEHLIATEYSDEAKYQAHKKTDLTVSVQVVKAKVAFTLTLLPKPPAKLLDVGCSSGEFMYLARARGYDVHGVEVNPRNARIARGHGLAVTEGELKHASFPPHSFDVINLGDVIEHVTDPRDLLERCFNLFAPAGVLLVTTPNLDCFWSRATFRLFTWFGIEWSSVTPPFHLFQFSVNNLDLILKQVGFKKKQSFFFPPHSLKYELGFTHVLGSLKRNPSIRTLSRFIMALAMYPVLFYSNLLRSSRNRKDFSMISLYTL